MSSLASSAISMVPFAIIDDDDNEISRQVGMFEENLDKFQTVRGVFGSGPKKIKATICYPTLVGPKFGEVIRRIDALQLTSKNTQVATSAGWKGQEGDKVLVKLGCEGAGAKVEKLPSAKECLRFLKC